MMTIVRIDAEARWSDVVIHNNTLYYTGVPENLDAEWDDALAFRYDYEVLPVSVISRFIVRMHHRVHEDIYWRKGVVFQSQDGDVQARVRGVWDPDQYPYTPLPRGVAVEVDGGFELG